MAASVISDRRARRKRGGVWGWFGRRFGALAVTVFALGSVSWISPLLDGAPPPGAHVHANPAAAAPPPKTAGLVKPLVKLAEIDAAVLETPQHRRRGISLRGGHPPREDRFEILNAAELDAISQAR